MLINFNINYIMCFKLSYSHCICVPSVRTQNKESVTVMRDESTLALNISHFSMQTPDLYNKMVYLKASDLPLMCFNTRACPEDLHRYLWTSSEDGAQVCDTTINRVTTAANVAEIRG